MVSLNVLVYQYADICATTLCMGLGLLRDVVTVNFLGVGIGNPTPNSQPGGPGTTLRLASYLLTYLLWVALPGAYATTSIALLDIGARRPLYDKAAVLEKADIQSVSGGKVNILGDHSMSF
jgi:hypothetical protein